jgi:hypothetical protein
MTEVISSGGYCEVAAIQKARPHNSDSLTGNQEHESDRKRKYKSTRVVGWLLDYFVAVT